MQIKVLGTGCANCKTTMKLIEDAASAKGVSVDLEKVEDMQAIMGYGVMSTPGVVIDDKVVHAGGIPSKDAIDGWLSGVTEATSLKRQVLQVIQMAAAVAVSVAKEYSDVQTRRMVPLVFHELDVSGVFRGSRRFWSKAVIHRSPCH